ncbi:MAG: methylmalonyl-CoA mutase family protein [Bacteroidota bacterium]
MFDVFQKNSKADWLAKVEKDLKGRSMVEDFLWEASGLSLSPFYTREDTKVHPPIIDHRTDNRWAMGLPIIVEDYKAANRLALDDLKKGASALFFFFTQQPDKIQISQLLDGIQLEWIETFFEGEITPVFVETLYQWATEHDLQPTQISTAFHFKDTLGPTELSLLNQFPKARLLTVDTRRGQNPLIYFLQKANHLLQSLASKDVSGLDFTNKFQFLFHLDTDYFLGIAKLRAARLLWKQLCEAWQIERDQPANFLVFINPTSFGEDEHYNKIRLTTQAMSAIIGGATQLCLRPSDAMQHKNGTVFSRRVALNVHHLLQQESYLDRVIDPSAGSYFIEYLTDELAEKAWNEFRKKLQ